MFIKINQINGRNYQIQGELHYTGEQYRRKTRNENLGIKEEIKQEVIGLNEENDRDREGFECENNRIKRRKL